MYLVRRIIITFGKNSMNSFLTNGDILCVDGDLKKKNKLHRNILIYWYKVSFPIENQNKCFHLKWMFRTHTVVQTDSDTKIIVNSKYLPSNGIASDVGGIISAKSKKNTVNDTKIEMHKVTWVYKIWKINSLSRFKKNQCFDDSYILFRLNHLANKTPTLWGMLTQRKEWSSSRYKRASFVSSSI